MNILDKIQRKRQRTSNPESSLPVLRVEVVDMEAESEVAHLPEIPSVVELTREDVFPSPRMEAGIKGSKGKAP